MLSPNLFKTESGEIWPFDQLRESSEILREAAASGNLRVLLSLLGPAYRGFIRQRAKNEEVTKISLGHQVRFDWQYKRQHPEMRRLTEAAKTSQWNATTDLDWTISVDPFDPNRRLLPDEFHPASALPFWSRLTEREKAQHRLAFLSWLLSQFLHGEQGALFAAAQVTQAVPWTDAKLYGSTQVADEGRHVEAFHTYLTTKLEKLYEINDNLYVIIDALMSDSRWDIKFLGMQIMIEGLALGSFGTIRHLTDEPLLKEMLRRIITDEARHVHFGVLALEEFYLKEATANERRKREDWTFEMALLLRNRFLLQELYDEYYAHLLSRREWNKVVLRSPLMALFRRTMFRRVIPNIKRIGLLSERVRPLYEQLGLLEYEEEKAAPDLTVDDLLKESSTAG